MTHSQLKQRQQLYFQLSTKIALLSPEEASALLNQDDGLSSWGQSQTINLDGTSVFVKRIPLTSLEYDNLYSSKNHYELPNFYHYPFGSAGFGASRELIGHIKTTNWVLAGDIESFPLLYHYRVLPRSGSQEAFDAAAHKRFIKYWGDDTNIGRFQIERAQASYELILFLEHIPFAVGNWLLEHPAKIADAVGETGRAITFLRQRNVLHLDVHFFNIVTDGQHFYLTDFGLVLDSQFDLTASERAFHQKHSEFDYGLVLWSLGYHLYWKYRQLDDENKRLVETICQCGAGEVTFESMVTAMLDHLDELVPLAPLRIVPEFLALLKRYRPVIDHIHTFHVAMRHNDNKDTPFEQAELQRLLLECGFLDTI